MANKLPEIATLARHFEKRSKDNTAAVVKCGSCTVCCRVVRVALSEKFDDPEKYEHKEKIDGRWALKQNEDKSCAYLVDGKCSIYNDRPHECRTFDCQPLLHLVNELGTEGVGIQSEWGEMIEDVANNVFDKPHYDKQGRKDLETYVARFHERIKQVPPDVAFLYALADVRMIHKGMR